MDQLEQHAAIMAEFEKLQRAILAYDEMMIHGQNLLEVHPDWLLRFARAYATLSDTDAEHFGDLIAGFVDIDPSAIRVIRERVGGFNRRIDDLLGNYD